MAKKTWRNTRATREMRSGARGREQGSNNTTAEQETKTDRSQEGEAAEEKE